ncbi:BppU family phage baseplate upper protein [Enterococcus hirae]|uniref:BppU family phage baseplate upper protein n=1 Tax=Enterococcus hirae TaxID=1354 RepID=UPI003D6BA908
MANKVLNLDFSKDPIATPIIYGRVGDSDMQTITINISKRDEVANLIGGVIAFEGVPCGGKVKVFDSNNIASTNNGLQKGTFEYTFPSKAFSVAGVYERAYFSFTKGNQRDTTGDFKIIVQSTADIDSDEAETIITEYNKLVSQLNSAYQNTLNRMNSDYNNISRRIQSITSDLNQLQTRIEGIIGNAQSNISSKISEASTSLTNIAQSVKNEISSALAELRAADFYNKFESDNKFLSKNDASIIYSQKNKVVDNFSNQSIDGFKNFLQNPTVKGVNLAKETFGITLTGGQLGRVEVKDGTILKWGTPYSYDNERSRNNDLFTISSDLKTMTILKDCTLQFNGKFCCQTGDSKYYAYLEIAVNGGSKWRAAGIAGSLNWRNDVGWFMVRKFNAGDKVTLVTGTNYTSSSVNAWGVDQVHIQEVIRA